MRKIVPTVAEIIESNGEPGAAAFSPYAHLAGVAPKAQDDDDNARAQDKDDEKDDKEDKESKARKAKKAKAAEDDDKDDDDEKKEKAARRAERARIRAIMTCPGATRNLDYAEYLAFETDLPEAEAIGHVTHSVPKDYIPQPKKDSLRERMASEKIPDVGAGDAAQPDLSSPAAMAAAIIAAGKKRRGEIA